MARQPKDVKIAGAFVTPGDRAGWVRSSASTAVPSQIRALLHLEEPPVVVQMFITVDAGARALIREIAVSPQAVDVAITTSLLRRVPVDYLLRYALEKASVTAKGRPDIHEGAFQLNSDPEHQAWVSPPPPSVGRGHDVPLDRVQRAAEVYKQALASGSRSPGMEVAAAMGYSRATAARDIRQARERGLIAPEGHEAQQAPTGLAKAPQPGVVPPNPVWQSLHDPNRWEPLEDWTAGFGEEIKHPGVSGDPSAPGIRPLPEPRLQDGEEDGEGNGEDQ
ncbi:hypothetical protein [Streptomyces hokutonensis]|uniref:Uncharacterized protein n=1 Tax=Streptomyces hokutonensis TaxID=1306990 RepID=A0ABW6M778_9ACTN